MIDMKRLLISPLMALILLFTPFPVHAADSFDITNLSNFDVFCYSAGYSDSPIALDGRIEKSEYTKPREITPDNGLSVTDFGATCRYQESIDRELLSKAKQTVCISCDSQYFYIAAGFSPELSEGIRPINHSIYGNCFSISVDFSLSVSKFNPFLTYGNVRNTYLFSAKTLECVGVFGTRDLIVSDRRSLVGQISSRSPSSETAYRAPDGVLWNGAYYMKQAILCQNQDGQFSLVFETRIPVGEVLLTVPKSERDALFVSLRAKSNDVCGQIDIKTALSDTVTFPSGETDALYLSTALFGTELCPLSSDGKNWSEVYSKLTDFVDLPTNQPIFRPFTFGAIVEKDPVEKENENHLDPSQTEIEQEGKEANPNDDLSSAVIGQIETTTTADTLDKIGESESKHEDVNDFPNVSLFVPEDTQIVYLDTTTRGQKGESDPIGGTVLVVCGILLLFSVVMVAVNFRFMEKKEKETKNH